MTPAITLAVASVLAGLLALGWLERRSRDRAHGRVRIRVHVNGSRGKSTVTRLIAAALRAAGHRTVAKTTGTAPRLILPDGSERPIRRRAPASIREQLWVLREACRLGADALVVECMAIDPPLQRASEREMIRATIGVVTNVRPDHGDVMGLTAGEVADALAHGLPEGAVIVLGETAHAGAFTRVAGRLGSRVVDAVAAREAVDAHPGTAGAAPWHRQNLAAALAVTREIGIPDAVALGAMLAAPPDPGAMTVRTGRIADRDVTLVDGSAANDPDSLQLILASVPATGARLFVFNHRADRPLRLRQFAAAPLWAEEGVSVLVTGDAPDRGTRRRVERALRGARPGFAPASRLARTLGERLAHDAQIATVVFCGNTKGFDVNAVVHAAVGVPS